MLPVFFTVFAGIHMFHDGFTAKMIAMNSGRSAAWAIVNNYDECGNGGDGSAPPPVAGESGPPPGVDVPPGVSDDPATVDGEVTDGGLGGSESGTEGGIKANSIINGVIGSLFGKEHNVVQTESYDVPGYLGGGTREASPAKYWVICNPRPVNFGELLKNMFCSLTGLC